MADSLNPVLAVVNPATGRAPLGPIVDELRRQAADLRIDLTIVFTTHAGHAVNLAQDAVPSGCAIIAVGGDGTVSDVVTGIIGSDCAVGIVPTGSTNMIAKELGIPRDVTSAMRIALASPARREIDVARTGSTTFLHMAGAGFDAAVMRDANPSVKRRLGWIAYLPAAARHLRFPMFDLDVTVDGVAATLPARTVLCAIGSSIIHPRFRVGEGIDRADGLIDVCIFSPPGLLATASCAWWIARGTPGRSRWLRQLRGRSVRLSSNLAIPFEVDGDPQGELPVEIEMLDQRVSVIVPR